MALHVDDCIAGHRSQRARRRPDTRAAMSHAPARPEPWRSIPIATAPPRSSAFAAQIASRANRDKTCPRSSSWPERVITPTPILQQASQILFSTDNRVQSAACDEARQAAASSGGWLAALPRSHGSNAPMALIAAMKRGEATARSCGRGGHHRNRHRKAAAARSRLRQRLLLPKSLLLCWPMRPTYTIGSIIRTP